MLAVLLGVIGRLRSKAWIAVLLWLAVVMLLLEVLPVAELG